MTGFHNADRNTDDPSGLDPALRRARAAIDAEIARSGAGRRVAAALTARVEGRASERLRWAAVAATLVISAGLGGLFQATRPVASDPADVVVLDPLTFGAVGVDQ